MLIDGNVFELNTIYTLLFVNLCFFILINMNKLPILKSFLGDSGSVLIGYLLACYLIYIFISESIKIHPIMIAWIIAFPIFNIITVMILRAIKFKNPFSPDRLHVHHRLQDIGLSDGKIVLMLFSFASILSFFGTFIFYYFGPLISLILFIIIFTIYIILNFIYANKN